MFVNVDNYSNYLVDEHGTVVSVRDGKWRKLKPFMQAGYWAVALYGSDCGLMRRRFYRVHQLVCGAFNGPANGLVVNHKNGVKLDNRLDNLEYCTHSENNKHAWRTGLCKTSEKKIKAIKERHSGQKSHFAEHSDLTIKHLIALRGFITGRKAAEVFGMSESYVSGVWSGVKRKSQHE